MRQHILIVEDDDIILSGLETALGAAGFEVSTAASLGEARRILHDREDISLVLLDIGLPDGSGFHFCREICQGGRHPVIILTARDDDQSIIRGLDLGADDYVTKPFKLEILLSRIGAVLRRSRLLSQAGDGAAGDGGRSGGDVLACGRIRLIRSRTAVEVNRVPVRLTAGEYRLLEYLLENKNRTLTRNMLLSRLWDNDANYVEDNALTVLMKRLREKLGDGQAAIRTVRGIGYRAEEGL